MIGQLRGKLLSKQAPTLLLEVAGVGYEVEAPMSTFYHLPAIGSEVKLFTHFVVREDAQLLFGFYNEQERALFRTLIKVNGVGPKLALTILSSLEPNEFVQCVNQHDVVRMTRVPGVGKKTAERLMVEMRDRLADWQQVDAGGMTPALPGLMTENIQKQAYQEAMSALLALGYKPQQASQALAHLHDKDLTTEEMIRQALKTINTRKTT